MSDILHAIERRKRAGTCGILFKHASWTYNYDPVIPRANDCVSASLNVHPLHWAVSFCLQGRSQDLCVYFSLTHKDQRRAAIVNCWLGKHIEKMRIPCQRLLKCTDQKFITSFTSPGRSKVISRFTFSGLPQEVADPYILLILICMRPLCNKWWSYDVLLRWCTLLVEASSWAEVKMIFIQ